MVIEPVLLIAPPEFAELSLNVEEAISIVPVLATAPPPNLLYEVPVAVVSLLVNSALLMLAVPVL